MWCNIWHAKVIKCYETLASNSSTASSFVAANVVQELEDNERCKKMCCFLTFLSQMNQILRLTKLCKDTFVNFVRKHLILMLKFQKKESAKQMQTKPQPIMLNFLPIMLLSNAQKFCLLCSILSPWLQQLCHSLYIILLFLMTRLA